MNDEESGKLFLKKDDFEIKTKRRNVDLVK
jgi:hypothetical protein